MRRVGSAAVLAVGAWTGVASAQAPDTATVPADTVIPVAPVRVTVLRAPLSSEQVPYAVTVERRASLEGPGLGLGDRIGAAPGVQVDRRYAFSEGDRITIRGFGARTQFGVRGVKVLVDGIPATLPDGQTSLSHVDPWSVTEAEVLRGPASSQWGNAAGGVIRLDTRPSSRESGGAAAVLAGSEGLRRQGVEARWGGSATTAGIGVTHFAWDGFREHAGARKWYGTGHADWNGDRNRVTVVAHAVDYTAESAGSLSADQLAEDRTQANPFNVVQDVGEAASQAQVGVTWTREMGGSAADPTLLELSGWSLVRDLDNPIPPAVIDLSRRAAGVRASVRGTTTLASRSIAWVTGVDAEGQWDDRINFENEEGERGARTLDQAERVLAVAPYLEVAARLFGPVRVLTGIRWDAYRFRTADRLVTASDPDDSGERTLGALSPSAGLVTDLGRASLYANVATAFETPTTTELANRPSGAGGFNPDLEPQRALSFEVGARLRPGPGAAVHLAAYRTGIDDVLVPFEVPDAPGRSFFRNAGSAVHRGVEVDIWARPWRALTVRAAYAWTDARFDDYAGGEEDLSGNRVPGVAPHRVEAGVAWEAASGGRLQVSQRYVSAVAADDANSAEAPAYALTSLGATAPPLSAGPVRVVLFGGIDNLLDRTHVSAVVVNAFGGRYYEPGPGRSGHLGLRLALPPR
ncbi:MAG: TonB-dependent receptor [Gemmatimonadota bacterium]